tara:strand:+ start:165 stop:482 length:318 start_codon:yes stop_codon:yes gene_type:complete
MTVKLVLLKSNEEVIADVQELVDEDQKVLFMVLTNAYCCKLIESPQMLTEGDTPQTEYSVQYYPWMPLSADKRISIDPTWVVAVTEPSEMVKTSYLERMKNEEVA